MANIYQQISSNKIRSGFILTLFIAFILVVAYIITVSFNLDNSLIIGAIAFSLISSLSGYFAGDKMVLSLNQAKPADNKNYFDFYTVVENLSQVNQTPVPKIYVIDSPAPNAFATGRDPKHSAVAVTQGLLDSLNDNELQAVLAHELGHIQNYDIRVSMIAFGLVAVVSIISDFVLRWFFWGRALGDDNDGPGGNNPLFMVFGVVALILAPIVATLIQLAISRKREYLADATAALTTRYPDALISALQKIQSASSTMKKQNPSTAHLFFANPLTKKSFSNLFSTHPPIEERIRALQEMGSKA